MIEKNRQKTTFNIKRNKDEFCVMLFKLINDFAIFQAIINDMFKSYLNKFVFVYLNDTLIYSKNNEKHLEYIRLVIETFHKYDYYAKSSKYFFF